MQEHHGVGEAAARAAGAEARHVAHARAAVGVPPEVEDARRRFILALRGMVSERSREERNRAAVEEWARQLEDAVGAYRRWRRAQLWGRIRRALIVAGIFVLIFHARWNNPLMWILMLTGSAAADVARKEREHTATALARTRDPLAANALAIAYRDGDRTMREVAGKGLVSILSGLRASDAGLISPEGMRALLHILERSRNVDLLVALMQGLEQVGDERAIPAVRRLSAAGGQQMLYWRYADGARRVQETASHCLPYLESRAENQRMRSTLVRPAASPSDPGDLLLRPAGTSATPESQLLRPSVGEETPQPQRSTPTPRSERVPEEAQARAS